MKPTLFTPFFLFLGFSAMLFGQNINNQWRFGQGGGIDFNTTPPTFVTGNALETGEGSASIADPVTGQLLFYTDGITLFDANNQPMPNGTGLLGGTPQLKSSTTAAVIVPWPLTPGKYFLVAADEQFGGNGITYSEVDMSLNGGLGDVVAGRKNIPLFSTNAEKLQVVPTRDRCGYWILTHETIGNTFAAFKVTQAGIDPAPVLSQVGSIQSNGAGHLKVNRQNNRIALPFITQSNIELFDFNATSGRVSNPIAFSTSPFFVQPYGLEFSPNGKYLYVGGQAPDFLQYDVSLPTGPQIGLSGQSVSLILFPARPYTVQLGPDNKIYIANTQDVDVINFPDSGGVACGLVRNPLNAPAGFTTFGLPNWIYQFGPNPSNGIAVKDTCNTRPTQLIIRDTSAVVGVSWDFGDGPSGAANTSRAVSPFHQFSSAGVFTVQVILTYACFSDTLTQTVTISDCRERLTGLEITGDTCFANRAIQFRALGRSNAPSFFWHFGDPASGVNDSLTLGPGNANATVSHQFSGPGRYTVCLVVTEPGQTQSSICRDVTIGQCCRLDVQSVDSCVQGPVSFSIAPLNAGVSTALWDFGDPASGTANSSAQFAPQHVFSAPGSYLISVSGVATCGTFSLDYPFEVIDCPPPPVCEGEIAVLDSCREGEIRLRLVTDDAFTAVEWSVLTLGQGGSGPEVGYTFPDSGTYAVQAVVDFFCGKDTLSRTVNVKACFPDPEDCTFAMPNLFTPNGDGINDEVNPILNCPLAALEMTIFDRWGRVFYTSNSVGERWNGIANGRVASEGVYYYTVTYQFPTLERKTLKGYVTLVK